MFGNFIQDQDDASRCTICQRLLPQNALSAKISHEKGKSYVYTYLYHQNIPEISSSSHVVTRLNSPKLTFSLSIGSTLGTDNNQDNLSIELCTDCCLELETLHKLDQELQNMKLIIQSQLQRINNRATNFNLSVNHIVQLIRDATPTPEVSMNGVVTGKENVSKSLQFLHQLCSDIAPSSVSTGVKNYPIDEKIDLPTIMAPVDPSAENDVSENPSSASIVAEDEESRIDVDQSYSEPDYNDKQEFLPDPLSDEPKKRCSVCGKMLKRRAYVRHMWRHRGGKRTQCQYCEKVFTESNSLRRHLVTHTGEKSFSCQNCGKSFTRKSSAKNICSKFMEPNIMRRQARNQRRISKYFNVT